MEWIGLTSGRYRNPSPIQLAKPLGFERFYSSPEKPTLSSYPITEVCTAAKNRVGASIESGEEECCNDLPSVPGDKETCHSTLHQMCIETLIECFIRREFIA